MILGILDERQGTPAFFNGLAKLLSSGLSSHLSPKEAKERKFRGMNSGINSEMKILWRQPHMNNGKLSLMLITFVIILTCLACNALAAARYVDSSVSSSGNGQSWATAWKSFSNITALSAGDTVYISGGSTGNSKTYSVTSVTPYSGTVGNPITYKIGQTAGHNGLAIFNAANTFVDRPYVIVSGDAGDGGRHFKFNSPGRPMDDNTGHIRISYVDCGEKQAGFNSAGGTNIEIDHVYFKKVNGGDDRFAYLSLTGSDWDANKIHHNEIWLVRDAYGGYGDDGIQAGGQGISVYNNSFIGYTGTYNSGQHQDGIQWLGALKCKIYNNYFKDIANYPIFVEGVYSDVTSVLIYNNVVVLTSSEIQSSSPPQGIVVGPGSWNALGRWPVFTNVIISNNTVADYGRRECITFRNEAGQGSVFTNSIVSNNICVNGGGFGIEAGITALNNVNILSGSGHFVKYNALDPSNDFHLISTSTLINHATNFSSFFTIDNDGNGRNDGAWDIGAYEFGGNIVPSSSIPAPAVPSPSMPSPKGLKIIQ